ncbi:MAG TPA: type 2 lanthipeptide synthetase LanM family protein [Longimicrobium sp.]|jgi:lantibiotic modifying enzyme|uniref:type 2 lanthipeptide synthetase LanM family protein n=1 Tax=Longimicrobium sp. TaxID=2029185 RepID=UPI002EDA9D0F
MLLSPIAPAGPRLSRDALARMVAGAASIAERLGPGFGPDPDADPALARARLARWRELVARGSGENFARRLAWEGLDESAALRAVGEVRMAPGAALPEWARLAAEACAAPAMDPDALLAACEPPPLYPEMMVPIVAAARARLRREAAAHHDLLAPEAHLRYEAALLHRLCDFAERAVHAFRAEGGEKATAALLVRYPVLARLACQAALDWVCGTAELLARLAADRAELGRAFGTGDPGRVADARAGLSDAHEGGRTVSILRFQDGTRVVYKPRPLGAERGFAAVAHWLNGVAEGPELRPLRVLDRGTYGWTAYAQQAECADEAAVERYNERSGKLLCLAYLLGGEDLHMENVIACGEHPVLIDLEVLLRARAADDGFGGAAGMPHFKDERHSVLSPGLLPRLSALPDGRNYLSGGLVDCGPGYGNAPLMRGAPATGDAGQAVQRGFRQAFRAILAGRDALLAADGPLSSFGADRSRVILRNTSVYGSLLQRTLTPRFLESGAERSIEIDVLLRPAVRQPDRHRLWPAFRDEARQLERMDVPAFHMGARDTALRTGMGPVEGFAGESGLDRAILKLRSLHAGEMDDQAHCIRITYASRRLIRGWPARDAAAARGGAAARALGAAGEIARWLEALAVDEAGSPSWIALGGGEVEPAGDGLGQGRAGIGLFLAALAAVGGAGEHRAFALRALAPVAAAVGDPSTRARMAGRMGIGAVKGMAGVAWGLLRAGGLLNHDGLRAAALDAARAIPLSAITADRELDVFGGAAGALLALLALHASTGRDDLLRRARLCGDRLLAAREADPATGLRAWRRAGDGDLGTGFGHGAAGIAHALLRLHAVTGDAALHGAAEEAFAFERSLARVEEGDWLDRAGDRAAPPTFRPLCAWCHGAAGIGLARAAAPAGFGSAVQSDLLRAVEAGAHAGTAGPTTLCCGVMGRAELLLRAADALGRPALAEQARALGDQLAASAPGRSTWAAGTLDSAFTPGLFQGIAGIGYGLLRLHHPGLIPSVLLWD